MVNKKEPDIFAKKNFKENLTITVFKFFGLVIALAVIIIFILAYQFLLKPKYNSVISGQAIAEKKQEYLNKMRYFNQLKGLRRVYNSIDKGDKEKVELIINNKNNQEDIFREIEYIANNNSLTINDLKVATLENSASKLNNIAPNKGRNKLFDRLEIVKINFDLLNVGYNELINVLKTIENNLRIMDVVSLKFEPSDKKASLELFTYQLK